MGLDCKESVRAETYGGMYRGKGQWNFLGRGILGQLFGVCLEPLTGFQVCATHVAVIICDTLINTQHTNRALLTFGQLILLAQPAELIQIIQFQSGLKPVT